MDNLAVAFTENVSQAAAFRHRSADPHPVAGAAVADPLHGAIASSYAGALAPVFWYLIPALLVAFVLSLFLPEIPLSDVAGMVARGEAVMESETEPDGERHEESGGLAANVDGRMRG